MRQPWTILVSALFFVACNSKSAINQNLTGKWKMERVFEANKDVTDQHNPAGNRWMGIYEDGSFESDGDPYGHNTGKWRYQEKDSTFFIDSDVEDDDSAWKISLDKDNLVMNGMGTPRQKSFRLEFSRINP